MSANKKTCNIPLQKVETWILGDGLLHQGPDDNCCGASK